MVIERPTVVAAIYSAIVIGECGCENSGGGSLFIMTATQIAIMALSCEHCKIERAVKPTGIRCVIYISATISKEF